MYTYTKRPQLLFLSASFVLIILLASSVATFSQNIKVLPGNGSFSQQAAPQGGLRYQRQFYLITPAEMKTANWYSGMAVHSIGFTQGVAQSDTTKGRFKVYLQNTSDTTSRIDTAWSTVTTSTNSIALTKLYPGKYEWQVLSVCTGIPLDTATATFSNEYLSTCLPPTSLAVSSITSTAATLSWAAPATAPPKYFILYSRIDTLNWKLDSTTSTSFTATELTPNKQYQWRVWSKCAGDSSDFSAGSFVTEGTVSCNAPAGLAVGTVTATAATLSWTGATGANYFNIRYRRIGTVGWSSVNSFSNAYTIETGLKAGTTYEWNVRTICASGLGAAVNGTAFTTPGTIACYAPTNPVTNKITDSSATLTWTAFSGATSYKVRYRLRETISWANVVSPMTLAHNDSILIPKTAGVYTVPFKGGNAFTYTGEGIYVAWEYERLSGKLTSLNTALSNGQTNTILSLGAATDTAATSQKPILSATSLRPETNLFASVQKDSVEVGTVYALGSFAPTYQSASTITARVINHKRSLADLQVTLTVKDTSNTIKYTATQTIQVKSDSSKLVTFIGWTPTALGTDSLIVTMPAEIGETVLNNNKAYYLQKVTTSFVAYDDGSQVLTSAGYGSGEGLLLARYYMKGCGNIHAAHIYLTPSAKNHGVYAVVLNAAGSVVASSDIFTPDSTQVNKYHSFYFNKRVDISNSDYYVGLAQTASKDAYYPLGVQWETPLPRDKAYYRSPLSGGPLKDSAQQGRLMIRAEIAPGMATPYIVGNSFLCEGNTNMLQAASMTTRFANKVLAYSTQNSTAQFSANQVLGTPDVYSPNSIHPNAWLSNSADGQREHLELKFASPAPINYINIYQTIGAGAVDTVYVKNPSTNLFEVVYSANATSTPDSMLKQINFALTSFDVAEVRMAINSPAVLGFNGIDAIAIGQKKEIPSYASYSWMPGGAATSSISITAAGTYSLSVTDALGCTAKAELQATTPLKVTPTISVTGATTFCQGDSVKLTSSLSTGNTWSTGQTTQSIFVKTAGSYTVSYDDGSGCGSAISVATVITINATPTVTISGNRFICSGTSSVLDAGDGFTEYLWSNGSTLQSISVNTANIYTVTVTNSNGCKAKASITTALSQSPVPSITGKPSFCPESTTTLDAGTGYSQYSWSTGANSQIITTGIPGLVSVTVTDGRGCTGTASVTTSQLTPPLPVISGTLSFCGGSSTTLNAGSGYAAYAWSTGAKTQTITVSTVGTFSVIVTDGNGCTGSASATTTTESTLPKTPGSITGATSSVCNSTQVYSIEAVLNASRYVWTIPVGATLISGEGTTTINVRFGSGFSSGVISVAAANTCGQSSSLNPSRINVQAVPASPIGINGEQTGLCSKTGVVYSIAAVPGATTYTWTIPVGASIVSGQGTTSIKVNFGNLFSAGNICVTADNGCGSSASTCKELSALQSSTAAIMGLATVCSKQTGVRYTTEAVPGATTYFWTVPSQAKITAGQGTNSITVNFSTKSGNVTVKVSNACVSRTNTLAIAMSNCAATTKASDTEASVMLEKLAVVPALTAKVSPNPSTSYFTIITNSGSKKPLEIRLVDALGRIIELKSKVAATGVFTIGHHYKPGTYYAEVVQNKEKIMLKLIKLP